MKPANGIPKDPVLRWEWIKFQLRAHGTSLSELARTLGVERNALHNVKRGPYPRMETAIAKAIGLGPEQIWPERWNSDGTPNRQRSPRSKPPSENG
ncbi:helix-turn-helix domain-containing protein [Pseudomonas qingdaonensis]|uniref:helix-turn-helix domain-containing protein n=1 Tax=Pseudomonas qingdaonensis TaxID=2056231 RepID=UPI0036781955